MLAGSPRSEPKASCAWTDLTLSRQTANQVVQIRPARKHRGCTRGLKVGVTNRRAASWLLSYPKGGQLVTTEKKQFCQFAFRYTLLLILI